MSLSKPSAAPLDELHPFNRPNFSLAKLFMMFEAFEKAFDGIVKICLKAHLELNLPGSEETWVAKCGRIFGGAMKKNFPKIEEDVSKLPPWDTYVICTLLKEYLQTVS